MQAFPSCGWRPRRFIKQLAILACAASVWWAAFHCTGAQLPSSSDVKAKFKRPSRQYSTGPLWVWNDLLTDEEIRSTLRDLAEQKVKQVWVHPRPGLMTPYLSPEWFRLWKVAVEEAKHLDMNVWIYDENSYPSGFAGGWVPELMPESRGRGLSLKQQDVAPQWSENLLGVYQLRSNDFENVTASVKAGEPPATGRFLIATETLAANSPWYGNRWYVNLLSPGVTEKFLQVTLEPYRRELGSEFGRRIPGVFSDEPNIRPAGGWPWSEILVGEFQKRWGYSLLDHLPSLSEHVGDWRHVRHNYLQLLNEQFIEHWSKPYHDYCASNHLEWTGHYWDHEWPNCLSVPDNMAMYAWHQRPAIDCLMNQYAENTHAQFGNARMVKELASVANQLGMPRTLCEVYGAGGWDLRFEDMKRIGDWLEVLGVNTLNQHLSYVTIRGARKRDHPQSFSYHEPWWRDYHVSAEYFARLSAALSQGAQVNQVLVLEPTTTAWMYQGEPGRLDDLGASFFKVVMALEAAQIEYDIGCEDILARHGKVLAQAPNQKSAGAQIEIGRQAYSTIVIPPDTENLNTATAELLEKYASAGGRLVCLGEIPGRIDGVPSPRLQALTNNAGWSSLGLKAFTDSFAAQDASKEFRIERTEGAQGILFHNRRKLRDGELLFLVNTSLESPSTGSFYSSLHGVERWDLNTGETEAYPFQKTASGLKGEFVLQPCGSLLLFLSKQELSPAVQPSETVQVLKPQSQCEVRRLQPNVLTLDYVDVTAGGTSRSNMYFYPANRFVWQQNGMDRDPWDSAVQFKDELVSKEVHGPGFEATYRFTIEGTPPADLTLVVERAALYSVSCNGRPLTQTPGRWWLDKSFGCLPLGGTIHTGENVVTLTSKGFTMFHELEPAYLLGEFSLRPVEKGFAIVPVEKLEMTAEAARKGWNQQGAPFYSAGVGYQQTFDIPDTHGRFALTLADWNGSVAEVLVNGHQAGCIVAPPWALDVTRFVQHGKNAVQVNVIGTLKNTLGPHHGNPALGAAWPASFQKGPESGPPPGTEYSTVAYGLFAPFTLKQTEP